MKLYLAGPMRGYKDFNFPAFHAKAAELRAEGYEVFSPAERDEKKYGTEVSKSETGSLTDVAATVGFSLREALGADCKWICEEADGIYLMKGWRASKGANAERALCVALGLLIIDEDNLGHIEGGA